MARLPAITSKANSTTSRRGKASPVAGHLSKAPASARTPRLVPVLLRWFTANARDLPWRRTLDPYAIWISEIMLQQTQVKTVIPYWERWMRELPDVCALANARPEKVLKLWEGLGYYTRVRNLQRAAQKVVSDHDGRFPTLFGEILALPGIGRYTAGAIASIAFNQPMPILDGNVIRVLTRLFAIGADPRQKQISAQLWSIAERLAREASRQRLGPTIHAFDLSGPCSALNQSLMELGATVCKPKQPRCGACPVRRHCAALATNRVDCLPNLAKRSAVSQRRFAAFVVERNGKWLVRRRPAGVLNAHLWEFPNAEAEGVEADLSRIATTVLHAEPASLRRLTTIRHSITRYRISLEAYLATSPRMPRRSDGARWLSLAELEKLPFTSAHRKVLLALRVTAKPGSSGPDYAASGSALGSTASSLARGAFSRVPPTHSSPS